jgi:hypothetical protein
MDGFAWDGKWELSDWDVIDGDCVELVPAPVRLEGRSMSDSDLEAIAKKIIRKLTSNGEADGIFPAYLEHLYAQLQKTEMASIEAADFNKWFYEFLQFHPSLMSSRARKALIKGLYEIAVNLDYMSEEDYADIFGNNTFVGGWYAFIYNGSKNVHPILWSCFWGKKFPDEKIEKTKWAKEWKHPYQETTGGLLKLVRHILVHTDRATRRFWEQYMKHACEPELFVAANYKLFFPEFIKLIFRKKKMVGEFATEWGFYKSTKSFVAQELPLGTNCSGSGVLPF